MKKLHVNFMKDLRNHEFVELYDIIISYIEKQQLNDANINIAFERVKSHKVRLFDMRKRTVSRFSIKNKKLTQQRNQYLNSLRYRVKSFMQSPISSERDAAKLIHHVIKPYGREFYVATILPQTRLVDDLEKNLKNSNKFRDAVSFLMMNDLMNFLIDTTAEIMSNYKQRVINNGEVKNRREGVRKAAYLDMKIMADTINLTAIVNRNNEEKRAIIEDIIYYIDGMLKDFRTVMRSRKTKRKNRKAIEAAVREMIHSPRMNQKLLPCGEVIIVENVS